MIARATAEGRWDVVAQLGRELEARRQARVAPNVIAIDRIGKDRRNDRVTFFFPPGLCDAVWAVRKSYPTWHELITGLCSGTLVASATAPDYGPTGGRRESISCST